jgi:mycothiol S-conjugate amidase
VCSSDLENGGYPHPDHIRTHEVSLWAYAAAADPAQFPDAGPAWQISKIYYDQIFNAPRIEAVHAAMMAREPANPMSEELDRVREWMRDRPYRATTQIDVGDFLHVRDEALRAHASQVSPESPFFFWPNDVHREAWPWEDFQLAVSHVAAPDAAPDVAASAGTADSAADSAAGGSQIRETDLFAGITDDKFSALTNHTNQAKHTNLTNDSNQMNDSNHMNEANR